MSSSIDVFNDADILAFFISFLEHEPESSPLKKQLVSGPVSYSKEYYSRAHLYENAPNGTWMSPLCSSKQVSLMKTSSSKSTVLELSLKGVKNLCTVCYQRAELGSWGRFLKAFYYLKATKDKKVLSFSDYMDYLYFLNNCSLELQLFDAESTLLSSKNIKVALLDAMKNLQANVLFDMPKELASHVVYSENSVFSKEIEDILENSPFKGFLALDAVYKSTTNAFLNEYLQAFLKNEVVSDDCLTSVINLQLDSLFSKELDCLEGLSLLPSSPFFPLESFSSLKKWLLAEFRQVCFSLLFKSIDDIKLIFEAFVTFSGTGSFYVALKDNAALDGSFSWCGLFPSGAFVSPQGKFFVFTIPNIVNKAYFDSMGSCVYLGAKKEEDTAAILEVAVALLESSVVPFERVLEAARLTQI